MTRNISVLGDSISTFEGCIPADFAVFYTGERLDSTGVKTPDDTWWMQVINHMGGRFLANASWSGSMVEGAGFPCGNSDARVAALAGPHGEAPDDVLVYYGTNDYGWGGPDAQIGGRASSVPFDLVREGKLGEPATAGLAPAGAVTRFGEAYAAMLGRVRAAYPQARIWCFTLAPGRVHNCRTSTFPRNFRGETFYAYNQAICHAAAQQGAEACDISAWGFDYEGIEGTHPTNLGMRQLAWLMNRCVDQVEGAKLECEEPYPGGDIFRSNDPCTQPDRACVGCPHAMSTGNQWMHVCLLGCPLEVDAKVAWPHPPIECEQ